MDSTIKIYLSLPVDLDIRDKIANTIANNIKSYCEQALPVDCTLEYYTPGQLYDPKVVDNCDIFIYTDVEMEWGVKTTLLPSGVRKEVRRAIALNKHILYIYENEEEEINTYATSYADNENPYPRPGSTAYIYRLISALMEGKAKKSDVTYSFKKLENGSLDRRLLLL